MRGTREDLRGADEIKSQDNIQNAESADDTAKRGMQYDDHKRWKMAQKIVLVPVARPREVEQERAHLKTNQHEHGTQHAIHERAEPV